MDNGLRILFSQTGKIIWSNLISFLSHISHRQIDDCLYIQSFYFPKKHFNHQTRLDKKTAVIIKCCYSSLDVYRVFITAVRSLENILPPKFNCSLFSFSYPTQRVAEGIMFLTRPSVSLSVSQSVSQSVSSVFLVSTTPLKPLNRISWNFVVMKDIMCRCAYL